MSTYAILDKNNKALNFIDWDGETPYDYGKDQGNKILLILPNMNYGLDWIWDGSKFIDPTSTEI